VQVGLQLHGHFDAITSSGFAEGWAVDAEVPLRSLLVSIVSEGEEVGAALANCYREGLAESGFGAGWCAFRARLSLHPKLAQQRRLALVESISGAVIHEPAMLRYYEDSDPVITSVPELVASDPTVLGSLGRLAGCRPVFDSYIKRQGVEGFVRAAYVFVLGRPADAEGISTYARLIRHSMLEPLDVLLALSESDEFRSRPRMLGAPNTPAFPFSSE
jgi:hypothetical protein